MTTKARKKIDIDPWDHFIDGLASEHIEKHRAWEWPKIVADLRHDHNYAIGEGQEPHWVRPGHAVLYHIEYHFLNAPPADEEEDDDDDDGRRSR
mgnify:CR=1 FL=1